MSTDRTSAPPGVDGVEIKVTLGAEMVERGRQAFLHRACLGRTRSIWFAERPVRQGDSVELPLLSRGVIIRVRQREYDDDATLKLRGVEDASIPTAGVDGPSRLASAPSSRATGSASAICCRHPWTPRSRKAGSMRSSPSNRSR